MTDTDRLCLFQVNNSDHTRIVIEKILSKFGVEGKSEDFVMFQILPDKGESERSLSPYLFTYSCSYDLIYLICSYDLIGTLVTTLTSL